MSGAVLNQDENQLILTGRGFGEATPAVHMGSQTLRVVSHSANRIVAKLPNRQEAATVRVTVVAEGDPSRSDHFELAILRHPQRYHPRGR